MQSPDGDSVLNSTSSSAHGNIEQLRRDFLASYQAIKTSAVLSKGQKRRLQTKRALRKARDRAYTAEITEITTCETTEYFEDKLSSQEEVYSSVVDK
jgi:hypothetical protein